MLLPLRGVCDCRTHRIRREVLASELLCGIVTWAWNLELGFGFSTSGSSETETGCGSLEAGCILVIATWTWRYRVTLERRSLSAAKLHGWNVFAYFRVVRARSWHIHLLFEIQILKLASHPIALKLVRQLINSQIPP